MAQRNPFDDIEKMFERMSRQFDETGVSRFRDVSVDVAERDGDIVVTADLPGYEKDDIDVAISGRELTLEAQRSGESEERDENYIRRERSHRRVSRSLVLPEEVVEEEASASYKNGVLTVTLPKETAEEDDEDAHSIDVL
jgi:HSP20 family protein